MAFKLSIKIFLVVFVLAIMNLAISEGGTKRLANWKNKEVKKLVNSFSTKFGLKFRSNWFRGVDNKDYFSCKDMIQQYFVIYSEKEAAINTYTQFCKDNGIDATKCAEVMVYLNHLEFDMENVLDILKFMDVDGYIKQSENFKSMNINQKHWSDLILIPGFELSKCMDEFLVKENKFVSILELIQKSQEYKSWLAAREEESACSCIEVFGIIKLFNLYNSVSLDYIFKELCLGNYYTTRKVWTKTHYEAIVSEGKKLPLTKIFTFLNMGEPIAEAGWRISFQDPDWTVVHIVEVCKLEKSNDSSFTADLRKKCINLVASTIRYGFKKVDFDKFLQITDEVNEDFKRMQCKYDIVNMIFDLTVADFKQVYKNIKDDHLPYPEKMTKFLISFDKVIFTGHMEAILDVYKSDKGTDRSCSRFTSVIENIKVMFYHDKNDPFKSYLIDAKARGESFRKAINNVKNLMQKKGDDKK